MEIHPASWLQSISPLQQELPCSCSVLGEEPVIRPDASCLLQMLPGPQDHLLCRLIKTWGSWKGSEGPRGSGITPRSGSGFCGEAARLSSTPLSHGPIPAATGPGSCLPIHPPVGTPRVLHDPVGYPVFFTIADSQHGVVHFIWGFVTGSARGQRREGLATGEGAMQ